MNFEIKDYVYILCQKLPKKRVIHSISVMRTATELAKRYGGDEKAVTIASILHDIGKYEDVKKMQNICKKYFFEDIDEKDLNNTEILHGFYASFWVEQKLGIQDEKILGAIRYHTVGKENMSLEAKIVYLADAIEPLRKYENVDKIREKAFKNLDDAIVYEIDNKEKYLKINDMELHKNTIKLRDSLKKRR